MHLSCHLQHSVLHLGHDETIATIKNIHDDTGLPIDALKFATVASLRDRSPTQCYMTVHSCNLVLGCSTCHWLMSTMLTIADMPHQRRPGQQLLHLLLQLLIQLLLQKTVKALRRRSTSSIRLTRRIRLKLLSGCRTLNELSTECSRIITAQVLRSAELPNPCFCTFGRYHKVR